MLDNNGRLKEQEPGVLLSWHHLDILSAPKNAMLTPNGTSTSLSKVRYHISVKLFAENDNTQKTGMTTQTIITTSPTSHSTAFHRTVSANATIIKSSSLYTRSGSASCPIRDAHSSESYRPPICKDMSPEARRIFSPSVPPAHILAAFERCLYGNRSKENVKIWVAFHEKFIELLIEDTALGWVAPVPSDQIDECLCDDQDQIDIWAKGKRRHSFGLNNPPNGVWAAHARLRDDQRKGVDPAIVERDQDVVESFSADSGYCAEGFGKHDLNVKRFKVRRLSFTKQLAELQQQRK